jgi:hypothetical protein
VVVIGPVALAGRDVVDGAAEQLGAQEPPDGQVEVPEALPVVLLAARRVEQVDDLRHLSPSK